MGSRSAPARTFPGMYNTRYMDDYEAYARVSPVLPPVLR